MLSILCHVWKVVPDLYEAIISMNSGDSECQEEVRKERHLKICPVSCMQDVCIP